jgi:transcriptional regulator with XRE-family HTH domain
MTASENLAENPELTKSFQFARLELEVTELLCELMEKENVSRAELARRIGVKPPYITKVLRGTANLTLKTISDLFFALGRSVRVENRPLAESDFPIEASEALRQLPARSESSRLRFSVVTGEIDKLGEAIGIEAA